MLKSRLTDGQLASPACTVAPQLNPARVVLSILPHAASRSSHLGSFRNSHRGTAMHLGPDDVYHWVSFPIQGCRFCRSRLLHAVNLHI
ncbi:hypothetical protein CORC01_05247 [Colletotrichum orchidophilum]|uniref:Uncharacterized protein n=1 Tax=Colletotrichum orchidophilum TaxID=1209926 RepID=A0A1G4BDJ7_9PEZI|nr:uncharacterized protein CORC01_05247 [Colletotrichum orchidophilum]OHE99447.1 hypothetical protein CORC01_05247 [Colletotrichum orchidophilum]